MKINDEMPVKKSKFIVCIVFMIEWIYQAKAENQLLIIETVFIFVQCFYVYKIQSRSICGVSFYPYITSEVENVNVIYLDSALFRSSCASVK